MKVLLAVLVVAGVAVGNASASTTSNPFATPEQGSRKHTHSTNPEHDVHVNGMYVGSDPDPKIRSTLQREVYLPNQ